MNTHRRCPQCEASSLCMRELACKGATRCKQCGCVGAIKKWLLWACLGGVTGACLALFLTDHIILGGVLLLPVILYVVAHDLVGVRWIPLTVITASPAKPNVRFSRRRRKN